MKKNILSIGAMLGAAISVHAQANKITLTPNNQQIHDQVIERILIQSANRVAAKTTSLTSQRLVAQSNYGMIPDSVVGAPFTKLAITDSIAYHYWGSRGSIFNYNAMRFDRPYTNGGDLFRGYTNPEASVVGVMFDRCENFSAGFYYNPYIFSFLDSVQVSYTGDNKVQSFSSSAINYGSYYYSYNGVGQISNVLTLIKRLAGYDTLANTRYFYDAGGNLIKDSVAYYS